MEIENLRVLVTRALVEEMAQQTHPDAGKLEESLPFTTSKFDCKVLEKEFVEAIISVHQRCVGNYPDIFQNQMLTVARTLDKLSPWQAPDCTILSAANASGAFDVTLKGCHETLHHIKFDLMSLGTKETEFCDFIKHHESKLHKALLPLLAFYGAFKLGEGAQQQMKLRAINVKYCQSLCNLKSSFNSETEDTRSILSGNTLLGVPEAKGEKGEKGYIVPVDEDIADIEPVGCFAGLFFSKNGETKKSSQERKGVLRFMPTKLQAPFLARQQRNNKLIADACRNGTLDKVKKLAKKRTGLQYIKDEGYGLLYSAASYNHAAVCEFLVEKGVDPDRGLITPLAIAVKRGKADAARVLLQAGADIEQIDTEGRKLIHLAAVFCEDLKGAVMIELLAKSGADIESKNKEGMRAFHLAAKAGKIRVMWTLFTLKADVNAPGPLMNTPLHYAVERGQLNAVKNLLAVGADIERPNMKMSTPLHWACKYDRPQIVEHFIKAGADIEATKIRWETPLKSAVSYGRLEIVKQLLAAGANPNALTVETNKTALHSAAGHEDHAIVKALIDGNAEIDAKGKYGSTPLFMAAQNGRIRSAQLLIEAGANRNAERKGFSSTIPRSVIQAAQRAGNVEIVQMLERAEQGLPIESSKTIEEGADEHSCSWREWFEKYIVRVYGNSSSG